MFRGSLLNDLRLGYVIIGWKRRKTSRKCSYLILVRWLVKRLLMLALVLTSPPSMACSVVFDDPPELANASLEERIQYRLSQDFRESAAVIEVLVVSVEIIRWRLESPITRAHVEVVKKWKDDGGDLLTIESLGLGRGDCGAYFEVGSRYVVFADRPESFWSFLPWWNDPLTTWTYGTIYLGRGRTDTTADALYHLPSIVALLDSLAKGDEPSDVLKLRQ